MLEGTCEAVEPNVNPSSPKNLTFITDFTPPFININSPLTGIITNETVLDIHGTTEQLSNFSIYVNDELQLSPIYTENGEVDTVAILFDGINDIRIELTDKAENQNSIILSVVYNNIGPRIELIDPISGDIVNPIDHISSKLFSF